MEALYLRTDPPRRMDVIFQQLRGATVIHIEEGFGQQTHGYFRTLLEAMRQHPFQNLCSLTVKVCTVRHDVLDLLEHLPPGLRSLDLSHTDIGICLLGKDSLPTLPSTVERLVLSNTGLTSKDIPIIASWLPTGLRMLVMVGNRMRGHSASALAEKLPSSLRVLNLHENNIGCDGTCALAERLPAGLHALKLSSNSIGLRGVRALAEQLPIGLRVLDLSHNEFGSEGAHDLVRRLPAGLRVLKLAKVRQYPSGANFHNALATQLPDSLRVLDLSFNYFGSSAAAAMTPLPAGLRVLSLSINMLGNDGARALADKLPRNLRVLDLSSNFIGLKGLRRLAEHFPSSLRVLDLSNNKIECGWADTPPKRLPDCLRMLRLSGNSIIPRAVPSIGWWLPLGLHDLDLGFNELTGEGACAFTEWLPASLRTLVLKANRIQDASLKMLVTHLPRRLRVLDLSKNWIKGEGGRLLAQSLAQVRLHEIILDNNDVGSDGVAALLQNLPPCLRTLRLASNKVGDSLVSALGGAESQLQLPPCLRRLDLTKNCMEVAGMESLLHCFPPERLSMLQLDESGGKALLDWLREGGGDGLPDPNQLLGLFRGSPWRPEAMRVLEERWAALQTDYPEVRQKREEARVVLCGAMGVGKSLLWQQLMAGFGVEKIAKRGLSVAEVKDKGLTYLLWDVGCREFHLLGPYFLPPKVGEGEGGQREEEGEGGATLFVLVVRVDAQDSQLVGLEEMGVWLRRIATVGGSRRGKRRVLVVFNCCGGSQSLLDVDYREALKVLAEEHAESVSVVGVVSADVMRVERGGGEGEQRSECNNEDESGVWQSIEGAVKQMLKGLTMPRLCRIAATHLPGLARSLQQERGMPVTSVEQFAKWVLSLEGVPRDLWEDETVVRYGRQILWHLQEVGRVVCLTELSVTGGDGERGDEKREGLKGGEKEGIVVFKGVEKGRECKREEGKCGDGAAGTLMRSAAVLVEPMWFFLEVAEELFSSALGGVRSTSAGAEAGGVTLCARSRISVAQMRHLCHVRGMKWDLAYRVFAEMGLFYEGGSWSSPVLPHVFVPCLQGLTQTQVFQRWIGQLRLPAAPPSHIVGCCLSSDSPKYVLSPSCFEKLQATLEAKTLPGRDSDGSLSVAHGTLLSYYKKAQVNLLLHFSLSLGRVFVLALPSPGFEKSSSPQKLLAQVEFAVGLIKDAVAADFAGQERRRNHGCWRLKPKKEEEEEGEEEDEGVQAASLAVAGLRREVLYPLCRGAFGEGARWETLERALQWEDPANLHRRLAEEGPDAAVECICFKSRPQHAVPVRDIARVVDLLRPQ